MLLNQFGFLDLGAPELLIILLIVLLLFGGKKLPELSRSVGTSVRELRKGLNEDVNEKNSHHQTKEETQQHPDQTS
jgi:sec-independent protein translocase protein TatA